MMAGRQYPGLPEPVDTCALTGETRWRNIRNRRIRPGDDRLRAIAAGALRDDNPHNLALTAVDIDINCCFGPRPHEGAGRFRPAGKPGWYGAGDITTTIAETLHHVLRLHDDLPEHKAPLTYHRLVYVAAVTGELADVRHLAASVPWLVDRNTHARTRRLGQAFLDAGEPGVEYRSARCAADCTLVYEPTLLSRIGALAAHVLLEVVVNPDGTYEVRQGEDVLQHGFVADVLAAHPRLA